MEHFKIKLGVKVYVILLIIFSHLIRGQSFIDYRTNSYSMEGNRNINYSVGSYFQDLKRSVVFIYCKDNRDRWISATGFLVNTVTNTFSNEVRTFYIMTAAHVFEEDDNMDEVYISFDYEVPHETDRESFTSTIPVYKIPLVKVVRDVDSDISLLKVDLDNINLEPLSELSPSTTAFYNAYASGWTLHPEMSLNSLINISHPLGDHKKTFVFQEEFRIHSILREAPRFIKDRKFFYIGNIDTQPELGSSGSPWIERETKLASAVHFGHQRNGISISSLLENSWFLPTNQGLMNFLDQNNTWISKAEGGYIKDLIIPTDTHFEKEINSQEVLTKDIDIDFSPLYLPFLEPEKKETLLGSGIIVSSGDANLYMTVTPKENPDYLLYGVYANETTQSASNTPFKGKEWDIQSSPSADFPGDDNCLEPCSIFSCCSTILSGNLKHWVTQYLVEKSRISPFLHSFTNHDDLRIPVQIKLSRIDNQSSSSKVKAIKLPYFMPYNAIELFEPERLTNLWQSNKYFESRGLSGSNMLFINNLTISQSGSIKKSITTGNNGGYLNLVNSNFIDATIKTSYQDDTKTIDNTVDFIVKVNNRSPDSVYYKIWIDFFPDVDANHNYNFVDDPTPHSIEALASGIILAGQQSFTTTVTMPNNLDLNMAPGESKTCRLRVAISNQDDITQDGKYEYGEVEDYLVKIQVPTEAEALASTAKIAIKNDNERISQIAPPQVAGGSSTTNQNAAQNLLYSGNSPQGNALALGFNMIDQGTLPEVFSPVLIPVADILSQIYASLGSNPNGNSVPDFDCPNPNDPNNDPDPDLDLINFDPNNPNTWAYWQEFNTLYNNLSRIIRFWDNLQQQPAVPFIVDANGNIDYALFNQFVSHYNSIAAFKNAVDDTANVYDLMQLIYDNPTLLESAVGQNNAVMYRKIYGFILKYQCYINNLIEYENIFETALNVTNNKVAVAVDWWGEVIPNSYNERTIVNNVTLTKYPTTGSTAIIYQAKGDTNSVTLAVNSTGNLIYEIKNGTEVKSITSPDVVPLNEEVLISILFKEGEMEMFLNTTAEGTNTLSTTTIPSYSNYTELNNGARWGSLVYNYTNPTENTNKTNLEAELHEFLLFDKALNATEIGVLVSGNTTNTQQMRTAASGSDTTNQTKNPKTKLDFSIFPNPVKDKLTVLVELRQAGPLKLEIKDLTGKKVYEMNRANINVGHQLIELRNLNLPASIYILSLKVGDLIRNEKIVVE